MYISQVFSRETGPKGFAYIEINYFKELAYALYKYWHIQNLQVRLEGWKLIKCFS